MTYQSQPHRIQIEEVEEIVESVVHAALVKFFNVGEGTSVLTIDNVQYEVTIRRITPLKELSGAIAK